MGHGLDGVSLPWAGPVSFCLLGSEINRHSNRKGPSPGVVGSLLRAVLDDICDSLGTFTLPQIPFSDDFGSGLQVTGESGLTVKPHTGPQTPFTAGEGVFVTRDKPGPELALGGYFLN